MEDMYGEGYEKDEKEDRRKSMGGRKQSRKRDRFVKEAKKGFEFKPIYIIPVLITGGIIYFVFSGGLPEAAEPLPLPDTGDNGSDSTDTTNKKTPDPDSTYIPISNINDGKAHYYKHESPAGRTIRFFVLKSSDNIFRTAFDACDVCFREKKGYRQEGDNMVCNNCGMKFESTKINEISGGCNPAPLDRHIEDANYNEVGLKSWTEDGYLVIRKSDIENGAGYF